MSSIEQLEAASAEQGATVAALKKQKPAADKPAVDAAVAELLQKKAALKEALDAALAAAKASGDAAAVAALEEKIAKVLPRPPTHKQPKKDAAPKNGGGEKPAAPAKKAAPAKPAAAPVAKQPAASAAKSAAPAAAAASPSLAALVSVAALDAHMESRSFVAGGPAPTQAAGRARALALALAPALTLFSLFSLSLSPSLPPLSMALALAQTLAQTLPLAPNPNPSPSPSPSPSPKPKPNQADVTVLRAVSRPDSATHPNAARWHGHMLGAARPVAWPNAIGCAEIRDPRPIAACCSDPVHPGCLPYVCHPYVCLPYVCLRPLRVQARQPTRCRDQPRPRGLRPLRARRLLADGRLGRRGGWGVRHAD